jgi:hypothetical protein
MEAAVRKGLVIERLEEAEDSVEGGHSRRPKDVTEDGVGV